MSQTPLAPPPDEKDWTWVIDSGCPECGFQRYDAHETSARLRATIPQWRRALASASARQRTRGATVWSTLEYGCHVRDVNVVFRERLRLMLTQQNPSFPNWDQDAAALADEYHAQDPVVVAQQLADWAEEMAADLDAVPAGAWQRSGLRSNGSAFTIETLAMYFLHDVMHHLHDVTH